jgi:16S rRNA (cytosine967-C5)-methyltransferase
MRPEARVAAAIEILDEILNGSAAERSLTTWARSHRFAGSKDRAAIRDLVFDAMRRMRSYAFLGGGMTGRGLMIGRLRKSGQPVDQVFSGEGYAPEPLTDVEASGGRALAEAPVSVRLDCPDWLWPKLSDDLGKTAEPVLALLQERAPVFLRVNRARIGRVQAQSMLADEGIDTEPHPLAETALRVLGNESLSNGSCRVAGRGVPGGCCAMPDASCRRPGS